MRANNERKFLMTYLIDSDTDRWWRPLLLFSHFNLFINQIIMVWWSVRLHAPHDIDAGPHNFHAAWINFSFHFFYWNGSIHSAMTHKSPSYFGTVDRYQMNKIWMLCRSMIGHTRPMKDTRSIANASHFTRDHLWNGTIIRTCCHSQMSSKLSCAMNSSRQTCGKRCDFHLMCTWRLITGAKFTQWNRFRIHLSCQCHIVTILFSFILCAYTRWQIYPA